MDPVTTFLMFVAAAIVVVLLVTWITRPTVARMGLGYALHRRRQAALITAGLMIATTVIAAAGIAADSSGRSFTESLLGRLELTDVIIDASHLPGGLEEQDIDRFARDGRLPRPDAVALTLRAGLAFEAAASGLGDDPVAIWGIDPATFGRIGRFAAVEGDAPSTLRAWPADEVVVNEAAARSFGLAVGDDVRVYAAGQEVVRPVATWFDGHLVFAAYNDAPGVGPVQPPSDIHHPDNVHQFTYNATRDVWWSDLEFRVEAPMAADVELRLSVTSPGQQTFVAGPSRGRANLTVPAEEANYGPASWQIRIDSPLAHDVPLNVTVVEMRRSYLSERGLQATVRGIVMQPGSDPLRGGAVVFLPLPTLQTFLDQPGALNVALLDYPSSADLEGLAGTLEQVGREVWSRGIDIRNDRGELERERAQIEDAVRFTFLGIGSFSIFAGFMLIGVMMALLVEERKRTLAASRAIGAQRTSLTLAHAHEGSVYSLLAGVAGMAGALVLAVALAGPLRSIFQSEGSRFVLVLEPATAIGAVVAGFALTMVAIVLSAHSASRFSIAAALKGEEVESKGARRWGVFVAALLVLAGGGMSIAGAGGSPWAAILGPVLLAVGAAGVGARIVGRNLAFAVAGAAVSLYLVVSFWIVDVSDDSSEFLLFPLRGVLLSISLGVFSAYSTWLHMVFVWIGNRAGRAGAYMEAALGHLRQRPGRAALTISMFGTVLVVLTALGTLFATFTPNGLGDTGGFAVLADSPVELGDPRQYLQDHPSPSGADPFVLARRWVATPWVAEGAGDLQVLLEQQDGVTRRASLYAPFAGREAEAAFVATADFAAEARFRPMQLASPYASADQALAAVRADPGLVIMSDQLQWYDSARDREQRVRLGDVFQAGGRVGDPVDVRVIGLVEGARGFGAIVHPEVLDRLAQDRGMSGPGTRVWADPASGTSDQRLAQEFEAAFRRAGMEAMARDHVDEQEAAVAGAFQTMISLFLGLGIVIGMVSLALIMGRNVLIRRAEIGTLRALGAPPQGILGMFSIEALYVSLTSIGIGLGVGLLLAWATVRTDAIFVPLRIDWGQLGLIYAVTLLAALAAAFVPAWQASRIAPAQAVRHSE